MTIPWYDVDEILPDVIRINDGDLDLSYIVRGSQRTGIIDTGMGIGNLAKVIAQYAPAPPPLVINTHAHPDHWGGNEQFAECWVGAREYAWVQIEAAKHTFDGHITTDDAIAMLKPKRPLPPDFDPAHFAFDKVMTPTRLLKEGEIIDLGSFCFEVLVFPAHTTGSVFLLERERRLLFSGDTVLRGTIWLHLAESAPPEVVFSTYERLAEYADLVDYVLPAHGVSPQPSTILVELRNVVREIAAGRVEPVFEHTFAGDGWLYRSGDFGMLFGKKL